MYTKPYGLKWMRSILSDEDNTEENRALILRSVFLCIVISLLILSSFYAYCSYIDHTKQATVERVANNEFKVALINSKNNSLFAESSNLREYKVGKTNIEVHSTKSEKDLSIKVVGWDGEYIATRTTHV